METSAISNSNLGRPCKRHAEVIISCLTDYVKKLHGARAARLFFLIQAIKIVYLW